MLLAATGCGERSEPVGAIDPYPVTVQGAGEAPTVLTSLPGRIVALEPGVGAILAALGRHPLGRPERLARADDTTLVRAVRSLRPELLVAAGRDDPHTLRRAVAASRASLYVVPDATLADVERGLTQLGLVTDSAVAARRLVGRIEDARDRLARALRGRPRVRVFVDTGLRGTIPRRSLLADLIREAGGTPVAAGDVSLALADLVQADPDVYLATADSGVTLATLRGGPERRLRAVRTGRFAIVGEAALAPSPTLDRVLLDLAHVLHPEAVR